LQEKVYKTCITDLDATENRVGQLSQKLGLVVTAEAMMIAPEQ